MPQKIRFPPFKGFSLAVAAVLISATAAYVGHAEPESMDSMIRNDRSDEAVSEAYLAAPGELATDEEFEKAIEDQNAIAGEDDGENPAPDLGSTGSGKRPSPRPKSKTRRHRIILAQPSGLNFEYTPFGGMNPPLKLCSLFMDEKGNLNSYGRIVRDYILEEKAREGSSRFLSDDLVGMEGEKPEICPNWKSFDDRTKIEFWVWMFAATAFEESRCKATIPDHFDINDFAVGLYQLERNVKIRGRRGPNCLVSAKSIHTPYSNIRCAMDIIRYQLLPISDGPLTQSGRLYSGRGEKTNSYFYWLRQSNGGEIGRHLRNFKPCGFDGTKFPNPVEPASSAEDRSSRFGPFLYPFPSSSPTPPPNPFFPFISSAPGNRGR